LENVNKMPKSNLHFFKTHNEIASLTGWKPIGHFGNYLLFQKGNLRLTMEPSTKKIVTRYQFLQSGDSVNDAGL
jgi:hypothetical protein